MKAGVPWSVKGLRPELRETAKEAARRSGMPLADWLNAVIVQSAEDAGIDPADFEIGDDSHSGADISAVHQRLEDLTRKIDRLTRSGPEAYAPPAIRNAPDQRTQLINRLERRIDQFAAAAAPQPHYAPPPVLPPAPPLVPGLAGGLDQAVAEIAARQRALNAGNAGRAPGAPPPPAAAPMPAHVPMPQAVRADAARAPVPTQDLSGLEDQLRRITTQIETLRHPGVEEAINALRGELSEIGSALNEAMPRQALDTIERQIQGLTHRIAEGRQAGVDADALAGIEHGLAEVRDAVRGLTPAESLIGFNEAVAGLAHKIDLIVAEKDPATLHQLEAAITTLREISTHIASNETVGHLSSEVAMLAEKVDRIANASAAGDALGNLEQRISALSEALAERSQSGARVPPQLEALVHSLSEKVEQLQASRGDNVAVAHLEDRIVQLVEKLDASDSRLGHLEAIERGLADLLVHVEEMRAKKGEGGPRAGAPAAVQELKHDIARTQNELEAVHGTLGHVVERLAVIEQGIRGQYAGLPAAEENPLKQPLGRVAARVVETLAPVMPASAAPPVAPVEPETGDEPPPATLPAAIIPPAAPTPAPAAPQKRRLPAAKQLPIDPDLPADQPLEPGSGPPHLRANPAARIAASEAALGEANLPAAEAPAGKSGFIAAARRAAQSALNELPARRTSEPEPEGDDAFADEARPGLRARLAKRVKSLFVAASIIAIVIGTLQLLGPQFFPPTEDKTAARAPDTTAASLAPAISPPADAQPERAGDSRPSTLTLPGMLPPPAQFGMAAMPSAPGKLPETAIRSVPEFNLNRSADITGSVPGTARAAPRPPAAQAPGDTTGARLPPGIGGTLLRTAAAAGDPAAAYEVAVRYAEGRGVTANLEESARWLERAAHHNLPPAQFRLASLYEKGQGVKKDLHKARKLYIAAAGAGNAKAMHNLAVLFAEGIDGKPDYANAAQWFRKAADRGISDSQYNLGILCARGLGTDKDFAESYKWFALAAAQGDKESARKRDEVAARLDAKALAAAQSSVKSWAAQPQPDAAVTVPGPAGGWDQAAPGEPAERPRVSTGLKIGAR